MQKHIVTDTSGLNWGYMCIVDFLSVMQILADCFVRCEIFLKLRLYDLRFMDMKAMQSLNKVF